MIKTIKDEGGYSLVEVIVSIMILGIAIIPMVGMFDMGLKTATTGSNYDKARALANANLEKVQSLSYADAKVAYKPVNAGGTTVSCDSGIFTSPTGGGCSVTTTYVNDSLSDNSTSTTKMRVEVTVTWDGGKITTTGLKAQ